MFAIGWPIVIGPAVDSILLNDDQIVVSVGPYMFQSSSHLANKSFARSRDRASPPQSTLKRSLPVHPASISMRQVAGVACITVAPEVVIKSFKSRPSIMASRGAMTTRAPQINGRKNSRPEMSNDNVVTERKMSSAVNPGSRRIEQRKFVSARCSICTPLG